MVVIINIFIEISQTAPLEYLNSAKVYTISLFQALAKEFIVTWTHISWVFHDIEHLSLPKASHRDFPQNHSGL